MTRRGFYEKNGQPGPYSVGIWSTWMSAQPDGRPTVQLGAESMRWCAQAMSEPRSVVITGASRGSRLRVGLVSLPAGLAGGGGDAYAG